MYSGMETVGARNRWFIMGCPIHLRKEMQQEFIKVHRVLLDKSQLDWFMPEWSGGLGICDVHDNGWVLNATDFFVGNPVRQNDEFGLNTNPEFDVFDQLRNDPNRHTKSRGALYEMLSHWGKQGYTPQPLSTMKVPDGLEMMSVVNTMLPNKPRETLTFGTEPIEGNVYDTTFGLTVMAAYLTDSSLFAHISGDIETGLNLNPQNGIVIEQNLMTKYDRMGERIIKQDVMDPAMSTGKKRKRTIKEFVGQAYADEWYNKVSMNRKVWQNNLKKGCTKLADWNLLQRRTYMKVFKGRVTGKGIAVLQDMMYTFEAPDAGAWSYHETLRDKIDDWD